MATVLDQPLTVEEFFAHYESVDGKYELIEGEVHDMTGGEIRNYMIAHAIFEALRRQLGGDQYSAFIDPPVQVGQLTMLYPDVGLFADARDLERDRRERGFHHPHFLVEVLSPSTRRLDLNQTRARYQTIDSLRGLLLVDPEAQVLHWHRRVEGGWEADALPPPEEIDWAGFPFTLTRADVFAA